MYRQDIEGSMAHAEMLGKCGIINIEDSKLIIKTLGEILKDIEEGKAEFMIDAEDIHMNIETMLIKRIGDAGKRLLVRDHPGGRDADWHKRLLLELSDDGCVTALHAPGDRGLRLQVVLGDRIGRHP